MGQQTQSSSHYQLASGHTSKICLPYRQMTTWVVWTYVKMVQFIWIVDQPQYMSHLVAFVLLQKVRPGSPGTMPPLPHGTTGLTILLVAACGASQAMPKTHLEE